MVSLRLELEAKQHVPSVAIFGLGKLAGAGFCSLHVPIPFWFYCSFGIKIINRGIQTFRFLVLVLNGSTQRRLLLPRLRDLLKRQPLNDYKLLFYLSGLLLFLGGFPESR